MQSNLRGSFKLGFQQAIVFIEAAYHYYDM